MDSTGQLRKVAQAVFEAQPFSRLLGAELLHVGPDRVEIGLKTRGDLMQQYGTVHGAVLGYLADTALTFAGGIALESEAVVTSEFKINFVRPARAPELLAEAKPEAAGGRQAVCGCRIFDIDDQGERTLCALATGTIVRI